MNVKYRGAFLSSGAELEAVLQNELNAPNGGRRAIVNIASTWGLVGVKKFCKSYPASTYDKELSFSHSATAGNSTDILPSNVCAFKGAIISMTKVDALNYNWQGTK